MEKNLNSLVKIIADCSTYITEVCKKNGNLQVVTKSLNSLVTQIDIASENFLTDKLSKFIPEATFLTEENTIAQKQSPLYWIIDPIDGTTNFIHDVPFWGVSVALYKDDTIVMGAVADISHGDIYAAALCEGAYKNGTKICVSQRNKLADALIATGFPYYDFGKNEDYLKALKFLMENTRGIRRCGAASIDLCLTASGTFDGFFEYGLSPWDVAAGALIVQEAGGVVFDFSERDNWLYGREIIACNPHIADEFISVISNSFK